MDSSAPETLAIAALVGVLAGVVRGITGFGGAMVMSPPFALLFGPVLAVPVVMMLESIASVPMLMITRRSIRWRVVLPIIAAACVTMPIGAYVLLTTDPHAMRRAIAAVVIVFSLLMLLGWRYAGAPRLSTGVGLGAVAGAMLGATSIGGPPVILYLLAGPDRIETTRANLSMFVSAASLAGVLVLWAGGAVGAAALWLVLLIAPGFFGGLLAGNRLFSRFNDARFRQFTLLLMIGVSLAILLR